MQTKVEICGVNTSGLPVLSAKKTDELLRRNAQGDRAARDELIRGNLRLVLSVTQRFQGRGESPDDLFQVGWHRPDEVDRPFQHRAWRAFFHLCRADERAKGKTSNDNEKGLRYILKRRKQCYSAILICWTRRLR